jgi:hypothetical protein
MSYFLSLLYSTLLITQLLLSNVSNECITIAILAKDKAHTLPLFLNCIQNQTWPKKQTYLYIRTNNNTDNTSEILKNWLDKFGHLYGKIYFNDENVAEPVHEYKQHEWNSLRFKVLGKIRQESIDWAYENNSHYFVVDCDNFIKPHTLEALFSTGLSIVAPMLITTCAYSNYHAEIDDHGYMKDSAIYLPLLRREIRGLIELPLVHCTYFIRREYLPDMSYDDQSYRYEYVIFSDNARKKNIPQYLDNRDVYGIITFTENSESLEKEPWFPHVQNNWK